MYQALYRTERPETFDEVIGQDHIVRILKNQVRKNQVGHAYLFCGTRGTGKTSMARILAKAVNCTGEGEKPCGTCPNCLAIKAGNFMDVIEIDAASNNGIDSAREIRESVKYPPSVGKRKVYIIDEAHELTSQALNGLLKTLEEPPDDVMFILATTDPQELLQTILSRCLRLDFHRIPDAKLKEHMEAICEKRGVKITDDALELLSSNADGSARDALSLLDQCLAGADDYLDREAVIEYLGTASAEFFLDLTDAVMNGDVASALVLLDGVLREGKDVKQLLADWMGHYRSLLIGKFLSAPEEVLNMSKENVDKLIAQAGEISPDEINRCIMTLAETVRDARFSPQPRILMELAIVTLAGEDPGEVKTAPKPKAAKPAAPAVTHEKPAAPAVTREKAAAAEPAPALEPAFEPAPAPVPEAAPEPAPDGAPELGDIWEMIWDRVDDIGSLTMVRVSCSLAGVSETEFKILSTSDMAINAAERKREVLENAVSSILGRPMNMVIKKVEKKEDDVQESFLPSEPEERAEPEGSADESIWGEMENEEVEDNLKQAFGLEDIKINVED